MLSLGIAFVSGVLLLQSLPQLPGGWWPILLPFCLLAALRFPGFRVPMVFVAGFLWALTQAIWLGGSGLPPELEGKDLVIEGRVRGLPEQSPGRARFEMLVVRVVQPERASSFPRNVRISWYEQAPRLEPGQLWRLVVRLKRPNGFMNPGGFDYEGWLFRQGIGATGYVRGSADNRLLGVSATGVRTSSGSYCARSTTGRTPAWRSRWSSVTEAV